MNNTIKRILAPFSSLTLTVILIALAMLLVYAGTWAQIDMSVWQVQKRYFHSFFTWIDLQTLLPRPRPGMPGIPGGIPMLGGYGIGLLMLINLVAAHVVRFRFSKRNIGTILIHLGLILLLVGEGITSKLATESMMTLDEGSYANYSQDAREVELAVVDGANAEHDEVVAVSQAALQRGGVIANSKLPFEVRVEEYAANSILVPVQRGYESRATAGVGTGVAMVPKPLVSGTETQANDFASAYVTLSAKGQSLGTYLVSTYPIELLEQPQEVQVDGKRYQVQLRLKRYYKPYTLHLIDFTHDRYVGTDIPKDFASHVRLVDPSRHQDREVRIWMNHPLRYHGETFYQASFRPGDKTSILQVVSNPAWVLPYVACVVGGLGMTIHFGMHLVGFLRRRKEEEIGLGTERTGVASNPGNTLKTAYTLPAEGRWRGVRFWLPAMMAGVCVVYLVGRLRTPEQLTGFDIRSFATLPISYEGRVQPLDSLARNSLKILSGREAAKTESGRVPAIYWLADMFARPEQADQYKVFRIDHPDLVTMIGKDANQKLFSFSELLGVSRKLEEQFAQVGQIEPRQYDLYQKAVDQLRQKAQLYIMLQGKEPLLLLPPLEGGTQWKALGEAMHAHAGEMGSANPAGRVYQGLLQTYAENRPSEFGRLLKAYVPLLKEKLPGVMRKVQFETFFNRYDPFMQCMVMYVLVFVLVSLSWLLAREGATGRGGLSEALRRAGFWVLTVASVVHTLGLAARVYISGRPPVTNLASSAIFIAWGAALLAVGLEGIHRNGIGAITAAIVGFLSLLIADYLALQGDTMKVLVAVLDTNFWLATHVTTIALGYASTFLAGFLGIVYVLRGMFTRSLTREQGAGLARMIYGIVCFAMLFSFVGTILGGIWADQSCRPAAPGNPRSAARGIRRSPP
ncbi:MAG TPA: cytochrome c biogenesis protein ResB [Tepidisphaeraceae bacterium]|nr:cytochrome c biogenesis protein ResB [Tepidisphaeraceae bacterium]